MDYVTQIFDVIVDVITAFTSALTNAVSGVTALFYVEPSGTETQGHMTFLGVLLLIGVGIAMVYFVFRLIKGLIRKA